MADLSQVSTDDLMKMLQQHPAIQNPPPPPAATGASLFEKVPALEGILQGVSDVPESIAELGAKALDATGITNSSYDKTKQVLNASDRQVHPAAFDNSTGANIGRMGGEIIGSAPVAGLKAIQGSGMIARLVNGALQGGTAAAATSNASDAPLDKQLEIGALTGGALPVVGKVLSKFVAPTINPLAKKLLDMGIRLTPGQIMGGGIKGAEDKLASVPVLGSFIANSQRTAVTDFNRAAMNNALEPIGAKLPASTQVGRQGVDYVATKIGDVYNTVLPRMTGIYDNQLQNELAQIERAATGAGVKADTIKRLGSVLNAQVLDKADANGQFSGETLKGIQSQLGKIASEHLGSGDFDDRKLGDLVSQAHAAFNDMLLRNNPAEAPAISAANAAWARYNQIRKAASGVGAKEGVFSGPQFASAVQRTDKSVQKGAYARGNALSQDISDAATSVLPSSVPDSGTAGRLLMASALAGGHASPISLPLAMPLAAASAAYTRPGQALVRGLLTGGGSQRAALASMIEAMSKQGVPAAALAANSFAQLPQSGQ